MGGVLLRGTNLEDYFKWYSSATSNSVLRELIPMMLRVPSLGTRPEILHEKNMYMSLSVLKILFVNIFIKGSYKSLIFLKMTN